MEAKGNFPYSGLVEVVIKVEPHHLGSVSSRVLPVDDKVIRKNTTAGKSKGPRRY